jgi:hypothetical protein
LSGPAVLSRAESKKRKGRQINGHGKSNARNGKEITHTLQG